MTDINTAGIIASIITGAICCIIFKTWDLVKSGKMNAQLRYIQGHFAWLVVLTAIIAIVVMITIPRWHNYKRLWRMQGQFDTRLKFIEDHLGVKR